MRRFARDYEAQNKASWESGVVLDVFVRKRWQRESLADGVHIGTVALHHPCSHSGINVRLRRLFALHGRVPRGANIECCSVTVGAYKGISTVK